MLALEKVARRAPGGPPTAEPGADAGPAAARSADALMPGCFGSAGRCNANAAVAWCSPSPRPSAASAPSHSPPHWAEALTEHRDQQAKERITAGQLWRGSPCVFTSPIGTPVDPRNDFREFRKLLARAGLPPVRLHDLRHTAASLLLAQQVPARVVMEILGHSHIALTMNTYSPLAPEVPREAADRMTRMLWQDANGRPGAG